LTQNAEIVATNILKELSEREIHAVKEIVFQRFWFWNSGLISDCWELKQTKNGRHTVFESKTEGKGSEV